MRGPTNNAGLGRGFSAAASTGLLLALVGAYGCSDDQEAAEGISLQVALAELRPMRITAEADGELEPVLRVEVKSKASGEILELFVDSGDEVEEGTVLAKVDPRDVQNGHDQAKADLDVAEAREKNAKAQLNRNRALLAEEVITRQQFESTGARVRQCAGRSGAREDQHGTGRAAADRRDHQGADGGNDPGEAGRVRPGDPVGDAERVRRHHALRHGQPGRHARPHAGRRDGCGKARRRAFGDRRRGGIPGPYLQGASSRRSSRRRSCSRTSRCSPSSFDWTTGRAYSSPA